MPKGDIVTGLDIGTSTIKALAVERKGSEWEVLSYVEMPSFGLRKGAVESMEETQKNIQMLMAGLERDCGKKISSVFVNINGSHLYTLPSDGIISVSRADGRISAEDVQRVEQATQAVNIPRNHAVLEVFPLEYIIDDQHGIRNPEGLQGVRLEAKVLLLCYLMPYFTNLTDAVLHSKLQINNIIPSPLAAADAVLSPQQKELGIALIDLGAATTSLAVYDEGKLIHMAIFPIGSNNITNDIAIGLKTEVAIAETIKKQHGTCFFIKTEKEKKDLTHKKIEIFDASSAVDFSKKELVSIIEPRVSEILDLVQRELKKIGKAGNLPGGVVLTGGGAKLNKIKEFTKETLNLNCQIGQVKVISGVENDPAMATVAGLAANGIDFGEGESIIQLGKGWGTMKKWFRHFIP
jgi:cell division protein FtsA